jgi:polyphosphate kinase
VPGLSDGISVRSLVGHFLEHSRIFRFGDETDGQLFIGSSDLMPRNLDRRVEAVVPIADPGPREHIEAFLQLELSDDALAWTLGAGGTWSKVPTTRGVNSQRSMQSAAIQVLSSDADVAS